MPRQVYSPLDSFLLAAFATAWALHKRAAHEIANSDFAMGRQKQAGRAERKRMDRGP
jgi:hypothetical protein